MERAKKDSPAFWHGPAKVVLTALPSTVWVAHNGRLIKACPEHLRPAVEEEKFILTDWIQDIVETRKKLSEEDFKGYIVLDETPPDEEVQDEITDEEAEPEPKRPKYRLTGKNDFREVIYRDHPEPPVPMDAEPILPPGAEDYSTSPVEEQDEGPEIFKETEEEPPEPPRDERNDDPQVDLRGTTRDRDNNENDEEERPSKRNRTELLDAYFMAVEKIVGKNRKEIVFNQLSKENKKKFDQAILKEIRNNLQSGAYEALTREESEEIRRKKGDLILKSRYVLTEKPVEPHELEAIRGEGLLLDSVDGEILKAKARHVMKGYSEANAENLDSTTPQVAKDSVIFTLQVIASNRWQIGHLDFTQAFHSGSPIERELYCSLPPEGVPNLDSRQLLRLKKTCYGLTDGPFAWYRHISGVLESKGYLKSKADPCLFYLFSKNHEKLRGIIALATDDMVHSGDELHWKNMEWLRSQYKMGKYTVGDGKFTGKTIIQNPDGSISLHQKQYIEEKLHDIELDKNRKKHRYSLCTSEEIEKLRGLIGALAWVAKESRPDVAGRVALLQQSMPHPYVKDIIEGNQIAKELRQQPELGILIQPIPIDRLRVGVITDASWGNCGGGFTEDNKKDRWEETSTGWDLHSIGRTRITTSDQGDQLEDQWDQQDSIREWDGDRWKGKTMFLKSKVEEEVRKPISERFLQLSKQHSQGGYLLIYYDKDLEVSDNPAPITIASWKSYKLKRCTVNTLSAECQSMLHGIGNLRWHRFLLTEACGTIHELDRWEDQLSSSPFVAVTDSKSLFDTITKCRNTSAHIDDKRTAIDLTILKSDLVKTQGQVRWVAGTNMVSDSLTKKMSPGSSVRLWKSENGHYRSKATRNL